MVRSTCAAAAVVAISIAGSSVAESMTDALIDAYRTSALLESTRALVRAQDESVAEAVAALRPTLAASASMTGSLNRSQMQQDLTRTTDGAVRTALGLTTELLISDGGAGRLAVEAAHEAVMAARQSLIDVEQTILLNAATAYHDVILRQDLLALAQTSLEVFESQLQSVQRRFKLGEGTLTDVSLVEARLAAASSQVLLRQGEYQLARESFRFATGRYPGALLPPPPAPNIPGTLEEVRAIARKFHPSIIQGQHTVTAARLTLKQLEATLSPQVVLGGSVSANREVGAWERGTDTASISISARMPLYAGGRTDATKRRAIANIEKARFELQHAARQVEQASTSAWTRLKIADATINARETQLMAAQLALEGVTREAALGLRTPLDVLDAEQEVDTAESDLLAATYDRSVAVYGLLNAMGLMTVKHLGLGIPTYDPDLNLRRAQSAPAETWPASAVGNAFQEIGLR